MKRFKNILVVISDNGPTPQNPALTRAIELARQNKARLTLMDVVRPAATVLKDYKGIIKPDEIVSMLKTQREQELTQLAEDLAGDIDVDVKVVEGRDFIEIVRQVVFASHDLLIKVANDHTGGFDSSDFHLVRKSPVPVWLLKKSHPGKCRKILAAVDLLLENTDEGKAMNTFIMALATSLARWEGAELQTLSCWSLYGENSLRHSAFCRVSDDELEQLLVAEKRANQLLLDNLIARYPDCAIQSHLIKGDPVEHIPAFIRENAIDVVVMGTIARSGIPGLLIGNTSESILHLIDSSVITLKPRGFKSPVG